MKTKALILAVLGVAASAGCSNSTDTLHSKLFDQSADTDARVNTMYTTMSANAAREDATLQAADFSGSALAPTGSAKLAALIPPTADDDVTVYVNVPNNKLTDARKDAVAKYFADAGVAASHVTVELGANPNQHNPTNVGLRGLEKLESADPQADTSGARGAGTGLVAK